jgi:hypothetical protein
MKTMKTAVNSRKAISKGIERICSHHIEWQLEGKGLQLWDIDMEHIQNCLIENDVEGELCTLSDKGQTIRGWWSIQYQQ